MLHIITLLRGCPKRWEIQGIFGGFSKFQTWSLRFPRSLNLNLKYKQTYQNAHNLKSHIFLFSLWPNLGWIYQAGLAASQGSRSSFLLRIYLLRLNYMWRMFTFRWSRGRNGKWNFFSEELETSSERRPQKAIYPSLDDSLEWGSLE